MFQDARLRECNYGDLNGARVSQIERLRSRHIDVPFPNGESYRDAVVRVHDFLKEISHDWDGATIVVIGHSATRWALDHLLNGTPLESLVNTPFNWQPGWRYVLEWGRP